MQFQSWGSRAAVSALCLVLSACGGGGGSDGSASTTISGQAYKGPLAGASICAYAIDDAAAGKKGALIEAQSGSRPTVAGGCVTTGADGNFEIALPSSADGDVLLEATGGTYCADDSVYDGTSCAGGGQAIALGSVPLRTVAHVQSGKKVYAPLTVLTTAATSVPASLGADSFATAYATIAGNFGVSGDPAAAPGDGTLASVLATVTAYIAADPSDTAQVIAGIASGERTAANTRTYPAGTEFVAGTDQARVALFTATASGAQQASSTALPGIPGSYARSGNTVTVTMPVHELRDGMPVTLTFGAGTGGTATSGTYHVTVVDDGTFTITDAASGTISGGSVYRNPVTTLTGTYTQTAGDDFVTVTIPNHGLDSGWDIDADFTTGSAADRSSSISSIVDTNTFQIQLPAAATESTSGNVTVAIGKNYSAFDVAMHPSGKWLYVTSGYDCWSGDPFCWGGDVITQYSINWTRGSLKFEAAYRTTTNGDQAEPVNVAINPAGTLLVNQDDSLDGLRLWTIDASTGALVQVAQSGSNTTNAHGVKFAADGSNSVYHGSSVFTVSSGPWAITRTHSGTGGNGGEIVGTTLFTIQPSNANGTLNAWSLAAPSAPVLAGSLNTVRTNRDLSTRNGSLVLTSGSGGVKSYTFDGTSFAAAAPGGGSGELQRDGSATLGTSATMYRTVNLNAAGTLAVSSYFADPGGASGGARHGQPPSGYLFMGVGADGALSKIADLSTAQYARAAKFIKQP